MFVCGRCVISSSKYNSHDGPVLGLVLFLSQTDHIIEPVSISALATMFYTTISMMLTTIQFSTVCFHIEYTAIGNQVLNIQLCTNSFYLTGKGPYGFIITWTSLFESA